jgi:MOSC domain-containing protein YiiM
MVEVDELPCVAGRGIKGDRFFDHQEDYKGQITFIADEMFQALRQQFGVEKPPSVFRRNVLTRGAELTALIGVEFTLQGIRFAGIEECRPCHWMDEAFAPGAEAAMRGRGGLRARILTDGMLRRTGDAR